MKCAVGCLISDEEYQTKMEGLCSSDVTEHVLDWNINSDLMDFLERTQEAHDGSSSVEGFIHSLDDLYADSRAGIA